MRKFFTQIPKAVELLKANASLPVRVHIEYSILAEVCLKHLYPKSEITLNSPDSRTGNIEVTVFKQDGIKELVHSKKNGQGNITPDNVAEIMQRVIKFVE
ncbi:unnamed protein product [Paramecium sonneborni]|uniref:Selenoprotein W n=1 Tax=Paramecium sonneborni TaxID=65129 RepID=A0A8S1PJL8_9CILI|nr:unnamed protein product [Paramecium sonneborni]